MSGEKLVFLIYTIAVVNYLICWIADKDIQFVNHRAVPEKFMTTGIWVDNSK